MERALVVAMDGRLLAVDLKDLPLTGLQAADRGGVAFAIRSPITRLV